MKKIIKKISLVFLAAATIFSLQTLNIKAYGVEVGEVLAEPEAGWQRIDDSNKLLLFDDSWNSRSDVDSAGYYNGTVHVTKAHISGSKVTFKFKGTKFRIIGTCNKGTYTNYGSQKISVNVDGKKYEDMSCFRDLIYKCIIYDLKGLDDNIHTVTITNETPYYVWFDAIDIAKDGCMMDVNKEYVKNIKLSEEAVKINVGESKVLTSSVLPENAENENVTWTSNNPNICTVDENGKVTAVSYGNAVVTATAKDCSGVSASCNVKVTDNRRAALTINMVNGKEHTYYINMEEVNDFTTWYKNRSKGQGDGYYVMEVEAIPGVQNPRTDYLTFNNISDFSIEKR